MTSRISLIFGLLIAAGIIISGCKGSSTDSNNNNDTTHANIGDTIPGLHSQYFFQKSQLDLNNNIIPTVSRNISADVVDVGYPILGKNNTYAVFLDGDTNYFAYESNSDVSIYFYNPGYLKNFREGEQIDEPLQAIVNVIFKNWVTLPIASKKTITLYNGTTTVDINGKFPAAIQGTAEFIGDSTIVIKNGGTDVSLAAKHCRITISANVTFGTVQKTFTHIRDIWFVPKIGYFARQMTRTSVPEYTIQLVKVDTTATLTTLQSYIFR